MADANHGDSPWWCGLDAARFEATFLHLPSRVPEAQFRGWVERFDATHTYPLEDEVGDLDAACPLQAGFRHMDGKAAGDVAYVLCVNECGVAERRGRHQKSPARTLVDLCTERMLQQRRIPEALQAAGFDVAWFREVWGLLCRATGFDLNSGGSTQLPPWLRHASSSMCGYSGLLSPGEVRALASLAAQTPGKGLREALAVIQSRFDCTQDAEDLLLLAEFASSIAAEGRWLLAVQAAT